MATTLYVGNLSSNTTQAQIHELFKASGTVVSCKLIMDKITGRSKGFAFVEMGSECGGRQSDGGLQWQGTGWSGAESQ